MLQGCWGLCIEREAQGTGLSRLKGLKGAENAAAQVPRTAVRPEPGGDPEGQRGRRVCPALL